MATEPVRQRLEQLGTIEDQLEGGGRHAERRVIEFAFVTPPERVRGDPRRRPGAAGRSRLNLADGEPFAVVTVWCPAELGRPAVARGRRAAPVLRAARRSRCAARPRRSAPTPPSRRDAELLHVPVGSPLLRCQRVTTDTTGRPVLMSEHLFPAHRTEFVVELPFAEPTISPAGLRLVE